MVYYIVSVLFFLLFKKNLNASKPSEHPPQGRVSKGLGGNYPCMAINVSVQYNGGLLPDIILLTQCYFHRGTRLYAMKRFRICSL